MARIVLMPGLDGSAKLFARFIAEISPEHNVTTIIYPNEMTSLHELCAFAKACIVNGEKPVVIAESFSGAVLCQLLGDLVPISAAIFVASFSETPRRKLISLGLGMPEVIARASTPLAIALVCLNGVNDVALTAQIIECVKSVPHRTLIGRLTALLQMRVELSNSNVPILALEATRDRLLDRYAKQSLGKTFQHALVVEIDGPHFLLQAQPKACWQAISPFINRHAYSRLNTTNA